MKDISLEKSIIKTIAGFSNHIGGNLYIGVGDNNELLVYKKIAIHLMEPNINFVII